MNGGEFGKNPHNNQENDAECSVWSLYKLLANTASDRYQAGMNHLRTRRVGPGQSDRKPNGARPWLGVKFVCAGAYLRVYRNKAGTAYSANCPKCGKCIRFRVGQGGSSQRFFEVSC